MVRVSGERLWRGLGAGALGTLALTGLEPLRDSLLGRPPPYAVKHLASRGAKRWLGRRLGPRAAQRWGLVLRWVYGPTLGLLQAWLRPWLSQGGARRGLVLGGGVWLFERLAFPLLGVTPPPRSWAPAERWWLPLQTSVFGLVTEAVLSRTGE
ncbi:MAG TPA: hypothetical protein VF794_14165 [Archangium sp.]|uniref:hypothetical protein n=1 Tax=Archangium sp. TaxID=1872627 RepID=UPI002EDA7DE3